MVREKGKKNWSRRRQPRPKFIIASATVKEWEAAHVVARALNMTVSGMLRQLISDQFYILQSGGKYISPVVDKSLDISEV